MERDNSAAEAATPLLAEYTQQPEAVVAPPGSAAALKQGSSGTSVEATTITVSPLQQGSVVVGIPTVSTSATPWGRHWQQGAGVPAWGAGDSIAALVGAAQGGEEEAALAALAHLPSPAEAWSAQRNYLSWWLISSCADAIIFFAVSLWFFDFFWLAVWAALVGCCVCMLGLNPTFQPSWSTRKLAYLMAGCSIAVMVADALVLMVLLFPMGLVLAEVCPAGDAGACILLTLVLLMLILPLVLHVYLGALVFRGMRSIIHMLSPVSSGFIDTL